MVLVGLVIAPVTMAWYAWIRPHPALAVGIVVGAAIACWMVAKRAGLDGPFARRSGVNLAATRGGESPGSPTVWLVAHVDSKMQGVGMLGRIVGIVLLAIGVPLVFVAAPFASKWANVGVFLTWAGTIPLLGMYVDPQNQQGARAAGAADNASGVAAVLSAAALIPPTASIGVLITDAEEMALAGATAWARTNPPAVALNCDTVDDHGELVVMYSFPPPAELISPLERAAAAQGERIRIIHLIPGVLTDHVAFARAGWRSVTLSRGRLRTLMRIHTDTDTMAYIDGRCIDAAARVLATAATEMSECK